MSEKWDKTFESPTFIPTTVADKWEGEDEDDDVKDNWDDEDPVEEPAPVVKVVKVVVPPPQPKKKKTLQQVIADKEGKGRKDKGGNKKEEAPRAPLSAEEIYEAKLHQKRLQEESDLELARESMGFFDFDDAPVESASTTTNSTTTTTPTPTPTSTLTLTPSIKTNLQALTAPITKEDFDELKTLLVSKLQSYDKSPFYLSFLEDMCRDLCLNMDPEEIKRLTSTLTALSNEKVKAAKVKSKKKSKKTTLKVDNARDLYDDFPEDNDYDSFI